MRIFVISSLILISVMALIAHADRLPRPPGPAYGGFMPGDWQYRHDEADTPDCG